MGELRAQPALDMQQQLRARRGRHEKAVHQGRAARASHAAEPLGEPRWIPRQVEVHDDARILEVHSLGEEIGGQEQRHAPMRRTPYRSLCHRCEAVEQFIPRQASTGDSRFSCGEHADSPVRSEQGVVCAHR